jgi:putative Holliday junction resolvase
MGRIMAIDYGVKRTGIAVSDPLRIIATGLTTVNSGELMAFLKKYCSDEQVDKILVGIPINLDGSDTHGTAPARSALKKIREQFPSIAVEEIDERFSSKMAKQAMIEMDLSRKKRRDKKLVDEIAATILLQEYMQGN